MSLLKPGSSAIIALIFGEYLNRLFFHATSSDPNNLVEIPEWSFKLTATLAVVLVSVVNLVNAKMGTGVQVVLTVIKASASALSSDSLVVLAANGACLRLLMKLQLTHIHLIPVDRSARSCL